jgi:hypothetical protein
MAILHLATLAPTKLELLATWLPAQPWFDESAGPYELAGNYRFDDPDGEVGIEVLLLRQGDGRIVQVPLTYRGEPLEGAGGALIGTIEHSVLGERWVYDGCFDPVYAGALAAAILAGGTEAELRVITGDGFQLRERTTHVHGSGNDVTAATRVDDVTATTDETATTIHTPQLELEVLRLPVGIPYTGSALTLSGVWPGVDEPVVLALARSR